MTKQNQIFIWIFYIFCFGGAALYAVSSSPSTAVIPKDKKFCLLEAGVAYNGSNDVFQITATCDGDAAIMLESAKIEKESDIKNDTKLLTLHGRKFMDEGMKSLGCQGLSPVKGMRYIARYTCTFVKQ